MIRLLLIGRPSGAWAKRIAATAPQMELDTARLPSAGIRQFEETPADLIVIVDDRGGPRVETLVQAIRRRPLGQLVPMLMISPLPEEAPQKVEELELVAWLPPEVSVDQMLTTVETGLDLDPGELHRDPATPLQPVPPAPETIGETSFYDGDVVLEPIDEPARPRAVQRSSIFRGAPALDTGPIMADDIRRKLKAVRHEDYYAILEVRRGAESQTVREAFHRLNALYDPGSLEFEVAHRFQDELDEIRDALEDAFAVLGDPDLREPYLKSTVK